uniref:hypothetical protein n=1 Tax=uncultured Draconibacterium sp. TaxID=1573823 RepID=UPI0032169232
MWISIITISVLLLLIVWQLVGFYRRDKFIKNLDKGDTVQFVFSGQKLIGDVLEKRPNGAVIFYGNEKYAVLNDNILKRQ